MLKIIGGVVIAILMLTSTVIAGEIKMAPKEVLIAKKTKVQIGLLICDKLDEVTQIIDLMDTHMSLQKAVNKVGGCGGVNRPASAKITAIAKYTAKYGILLLVRYEFYNVAKNKKQYGWYKAIPIKASIGL